MRQSRSGWRIASTKRVAPAAQLIATIRPPSSTINTGGWSASSSLLPITRSVLLARWIVSPAPSPTLWRNFS